MKVIFGYTWHATFFAFSRDRVFLSDQVYALKASATSTEINRHHNKSDAALQPDWTQLSLSACSWSYNEKLTQHYDAVLPSGECR